MPAIVTLPAAATYYKVWARPVNGSNLREAIARLRNDGNEILEIDHDNNRVLIGITADPDELKRHAT